MFMRKMINEYLVLYKNKSIFFLLLLLSLYIIFAPANKVFSENVQDAVTIYFRLFISLFMFILIPALIIAIRMLKKIWDS